MKNISDYDYNKLHFIPSRLIKKLHEEKNNQRRTGSSMWCSDELFDDIIHYLDTTKFPGAKMVARTLELGHKCTQEAKVEDMRSYIHTVEDAVNEINLIICEGERNTAQTHQNQKIELEVFLQCVEHIIPNLTPEKIKAMKAFL